MEQNKIIGLAECYEYLGVGAGFVIVVFMAGLGAIILSKILNGSIDLKHLISEENGQASLSRFQFLVFTFVIAMGLLVIILKKQTFPTVGSDVFTLLGISGGSYVVAKITQKTATNNPPPSGSKDNDNI